MTQPPPWLIPYVDYYDGPTRVLSIDIRQANWISSAYKPFVSIDGRQYVVVWGQVCFEIPVQRNVHLSVHLQGEALAYAASALLPAGPEPLAFLYEKTLIPMAPPPTELPR